MIPVLVVKVTRPCGETLSHILNSADFNWISFMHRHTLAFPNKPSLQVQNPQHLFLSASLLLLQHKVKETVQMYSYHLSLYKLNGKRKTTCSTLEDGKHGNQDETFVNVTKTQHFPPMHKV